MLLDELFRLHEHAAGAAAGFVDATPVRLQHLNQQPDDGAGCVEFAAALAFRAGKAAQEILMDPPENISRAVGLLDHSDSAHKVDRFAEHDLVQRRAGVILGQHALERGVPGLDRQHGVVDVLADSRQFGPGSQVRPAGLPRNPEDVLGEVLFRVLGVSRFLLQKLGPLCLGGVGDVLEKDQAERDMLVVRRLHVAAELVCRGPELRLEPETGTSVVYLLRHGALTRL